MFVFLCQPCDIETVHPFPGCFPSLLGLGFSSPQDLECRMSNDRNGGWDRPHYLSFQEQFKKKNVKIIKNICKNSGEKITQIKQKSSLIGYC